MLSLLIVCNLKFFLVDFVLLRRGGRGYFPNWVGFYHVKSLSLVHVH